MKPRSVGHLERSVRFVLRALRTYAKFNLSQAKNPPASPSEPPSFAVSARGIPVALFERSEFSDWPC